MTRDCWLRSLKAPGRGTNCELKLTADSSDAWFYCTWRQEEVNFELTVERNRNLLINMRWSNLRSRSWNNFQSTYVILLRAGHTKQTIMNDGWQTIRMSRLRDVGLHLWVGIQYHIIFVSLLSHPIQCWAVSWSGVVSILLIIASICRFLRGEH